MRSYFASSVVVGPGVVGVLGVLVGGSVCRAQLLGTIETISFPGPITGTTVNATVYLPEGYAGAKERMPVIYHLHGLDGTHNGQQISTVPQSYEAARAAGLIGPAIIVFPDGYGNAFWTDSATTNKPAETNVIFELIPYIDEHYFTVAHRGGRVIQGFSMGGFGAPMYYAKFPDVFSVGVAYDGSIVVWTQIQQNLPAVAAEIFDNSAARFDDYSPWRWTTEHAAVLAASSAIRLVVGGSPFLVAANRAFRDHLLALGVTPDYVETGLPHNLLLLLQAQGAASWSFIAEHLDLSCLPDCDASGGLNIDDFICFQTLFALGDPRGGADCDQSGGLTIDDFICFQTLFALGC